MKKNNEVQIRNFYSEPSKGMKPGDVEERLYEDVLLKEIEICLTDEESVFVYMAVTSARNEPLASVIFGRVMENGWKEIGAAVRDRDTMKFFKRKWPKFHELLKRGQRGSSSDNMLCRQDDDLVLARVLDHEKLNGEGGEEYLQQIVLHMVDDFKELSEEMTSKPFSKADVGGIWLNAIWQSAKRTKGVLWMLLNVWGAPGI